MRLGQSRPEDEMQDVQVISNSILNELLRADSDILDEAVRDIRDIPLNPVKENVLTIAEALCLIFAKQKQIHAIDPEIKPKYLKKTSPYPKETSRRFGELLIKMSDLCDEQQYHGAISLCEQYIPGNPPEFFIDLAKKQIEQIKNDYDV